MASSSSQSQGCTTLPPSLRSARTLPFCRRWTLATVGDGPSTAATPTDTVSTVSQARRDKQHEDCIDNCWVAATDMSFTGHMNNDGVVHLQPMSRVAGCRAFREWGSHRFLSLTVASACSDACVRLVNQAASSTGMRILGRRYALLAAKPGEKRVILFCEHDEDEGLGAVNVETIRQWHIPPTLPNLKMDVAKYNARLGLMFSMSLATVCVPQHEIVQMRDVRSSTGSLMSDGCAPIHPQLLAQISSACGWSRVPAAIQGRLGGCKGVWYADPSIRMIGVTPSMSKVQLLQPTQSQLTIEVCSRSLDCGPSHLNRQLIQVLQGRGVPKQVFLDLQQIVMDAMTRLEGATQPTFGAVDQDALLASLQLVSGAHASETGKDKFIGRLMRLAQVGLWQDAEFIKLLAMLKAKQVQSLLEKSHIPVHESRRLLMIADPSGTLRPGEAFVRLSGSSCLTGPVLVARNPCHWLSDVRKLQAVGLPSPWCDLLVDVVVLPVVGRTSEAQQMSGGDYDGDDAWVCWHPAMCGWVSENVDAEIAVDGMVSLCAEADKPSKAPDSSEQSFVCMCHPKHLTVAACYSAKFCSRALARHALHFVRQNMLGRLTALHAATADLHGVAYPLSTMLGWMCRTAVDAAKHSGSVTLPLELWNNAVRPHWMASRLMPHAPEQHSDSAIGVLYDAARAALGSLPTHQVPTWKPSTVFIVAAKLEARRNWQRWTVALQMAQLLYRQFMEMWDSGQHRADEVIATVRGEFFRRVPRAERPLVGIACMMQHRGAEQDRPWGRSFAWEVAEEYLLLAVRTLAGPQAASKHALHTSPGKPKQAVDLMTPPLKPREKRSRWVGVRPTPPRQPVVTTSDTTWTLVGGDATAPT